MFEKLKERFSWEKKFKELEACYNTLMEIANTQEDTIECLKDTAKLKDELVKLQQEQLEEKERFIGEKKQEVENLEKIVSFQINELHAVCKDEKGKFIQVSQEGLDKYKGMEVCVESMVPGKNMRIRTEKRG